MKEGKNSATIAKKIELVNSLTHSSDIMYRRMLVVRRNHAAVCLKSVSLVPLIDVVCVRYLLSKVVMRR